MVLVARVSPGGEGSWVGLTRDAGTYTRGLTLSREDRGAAQCRNTKNDHHRREPAHRSCHTPKPEERRRGTQAVLGTPGLAAAMEAGWADAIRRQSCAGWG